MASKYFHSVRDRCNIFQLPITHYEQLPTTVFWLLNTTGYHLPPTDYRLPVTGCRLPVTDFIKRKLNGRIMSAHFHGLEIIGDNCQTDKGRGWLEEFLRLLLIALTTGRFCQYSNTLSEIVKRRLVSMTEQQYLLTSRTIKYLARTIGKPIYYTNYHINLLLINNVTTILIILTVK